MDVESGIESDNYIYIISMLCFCFCICLLVSITIYILTKKSQTASNDSSNIILSNKLYTNTSTLAKNESNKKSLDSSNLNIKKDTGNTTELDCTVNTGGKYTCTNPINNEIITLKNGPIFKLSSSNETDSFGKAAINYYILGSLSFMSDKIILISTKVININTLNDLLTFFDDAESDFNNTANTIPDKCLNVPTKTRQESKAPYNQTCIFFPGLNKIDSIVKILEKTLLPFLSINILNDYYNMVNLKVTNQSTLTVLEYSMYLALLNKIKNSNLKYFTLCTSDNETINC